MIQIEQLINADPVDFDYAWDILVYFERTTAFKLQSESTHANNRSDCDRSTLLATTYQRMANLSAISKQFVDADYYFDKATTTMPENCEIMLHTHRN